MSPLCMRLLTEIRRNKGCTLRQLTSWTSRPMHEVEVALKSLEKSEYARAEGGQWYPGEYRAASAQLAGAMTATAPIERPSAAAEAFARATPPGRRYPSSIRKACDDCGVDKPLTQFFAGCTTCRVCMGNAGNGRAPGKPKDVTPPQDATALTVVPLAIASPPAVKPPMPGYIAEAVKVLEAKVREINGAIRLLREDYA